VSEGRPAAPALRLWEILRALIAGEVEFFVIGGIAVGVHGFVRATKDVDIVPAPDACNLERLHGVLVEIEAEPVELADFRPEELPQPLSPRALARGGNWFLASRYGRLDVMQHLEGVLEDAEDYERLAAATLALETPVGTVRVVGYADLLQMKYAAGRDLDLIDVRALREARGELE
jgi:hypothetical protein